MAEPSFAAAEKPLTASFLNWTVMIALAVGVATAAVFNIVPDLDLRLSALFFENNGFFMAKWDWLETFRWITLRSYMICYVVIIVCLIVSFQKKSALGLGQRAWLFMVACAALGPGLLTNGILKRFWGRGRPRDVENFGGDLEFSKILNWSSECTSNCSFVSGEVSSMFMLLFSFALISKSSRMLWIGLAIVATAIIALMRVVQGGHFVSDTIFASVFMALVAVATYRFIYLGSRFSKLS